MEKYILWMLVKKQHATTFSNIIVIKDPHTVKHFNLKVRYKFTESSL